MTEAFRTVLQARGPGGAWTCLVVPFDVARVFGTRGRVAVRGTINGAPFRNWLMPAGQGTHTMAVSRAVQAAAGCASGVEVDCVMDLDDGERDVVVPEELAAAILFLTVPVVIPVIRSLGFDPVWFGVIKIVTAEVGMITPPIGLNCFVVARYSGRPVAEVFRGSYPHFLAHLIVIAILTAFPGLILWLPNHME